MDHLLEGLCERLSLKEREEDGLLLEESSVEEMIVRGEKCLIFKLMTVKHFNKEALKSTMKKGKEKVKREGPWSFDRHLVITKDVMGLQQVHQVAMKEALFWVRIYDLLVMVRNANVGKTIGSALGRVIEVDLENDDLAESEYMRVRVCFDISKPLSRGKNVCVGSPFPIWVRFSYEMMPTFCYLRGILGHNHKDCEM
ncbi:unnamed protein product [Fraxinus pennsylvanica]|uniref:Zinc knuckle CX2CX4HX4C domain-containing protein n=1 Tax=Fraxinus pennsylvanica TaxID=56036 RepID=A0AAD2DNB5_9LAMI|nr:unnamed protein product [Fraxinus pennsylvanica]